MYARRTVLVESVGSTTADTPLALLLATTLEKHCTVLQGSLQAGIPPEVCLIVSCAGWLPDAHWLNVDQWCFDAGVAWHRCYIEGGKFCIGPLTLPGLGVSYSDSRARRLSASLKASELREWWKYLDTAERLPPPPSPSADSVSLAVRLLSADVLAYLSGASTSRYGTAYTINDTHITSHTVLPLPIWPKRSYPKQHEMSGLIDSRYGIITQLYRRQAYDDVPRSFVSYTAELANTSEFASWKVDSVVGGATLGDDEQARRAALGEAVERYCGNAVPPNLLVSSAASLMADNRDVLDPDHFSLYSRKQYSSPGFPFTSFTRTLEVAWTDGRDLGNDNEVLVPAAFTYLNAFENRPGGRAAITDQPFAGIAAGASLENAEQAALEELFERDAVAIWWLSGAEARPLAVDGDLKLRPTIKDAESVGLKLNFLQIPCSFNLPVIGVFLENSYRNLVGFGVACRSRPEVAARKALCEAFGTYLAARQLADINSEFWIAARKGDRRAQPYRTWRPDRQYGKTYRSDWRDLNELSLNVQLYLDPAMQGEQLRRLRQPLKPAVGLDAIQPVGGDPRIAYIRELNKHGMRAVAVDVTTADVETSGLRVVRVVVPGLYQLTPAAFPMLGGSRLYTEPVAHRWLSRPLREEDVVRYPLPFA
jgi:ribosomal protein S12 methylthiotransferase accessory factor